MNYECSKRKTSDIFETSRDSKLNKPCYNFFNFKVEQDIPVNN